MFWLNLFLVAMPPLILFALGWLIRFRKAYWLISGYNTMPSEKKKNVDMEKLGPLIGNGCFAIGAILFAGILLITLGLTAFGFGVLALLVPVVIGLLVTAQKYDHNAHKESGSLKTSAKVALALVVVFLLAVSILVGYLIYSGSQPAKIELAGGHLVIGGSYGLTLALADLKDVQLVGPLPDVQLRTNGSAIGNRLRGHFLLADVGPALLFVDVSQPPFIMVRTADQQIYLNQADPAATQDFYAALTAAWRAAAAPPQS